ncbi:MAG: TIGR04282 family arsenosugar biosynthesis glycosyltransferase [Gammaproteobacteria bacterium]|nr:TIGR04282 family arsenosugar biosynthesis glycosyltransferase [Gammaproteobacteria bacterium]
MRYPQARILVFCKPPIPGQAKTRLIPALGAQGAADLHAELVRATLARAVRSELAPVELWVSAEPEHAFFQQMHAEFACAVLTQHGDDLGARMAQALETALADAEFAVLIGTDCPALDADYLAQACAALADRADRTDGADAVLGPAEDGGYVLIGLRRFDRRSGPRSDRGFDYSALFADIPWGTSAVLEQTRQRLAGLGWSVRELPALWDVDRPEDLPRLQSRL